MSSLVLIPLIEVINLSKHYSNKVFFKDYSTNLALDDLLRVKDYSLVGLELL